MRNLILSFMLLTICVSSAEATQGLWTFGSSTAGISASADNYWGVRQVAAQSTTEERISSVVPYPVTVNNLYVETITAPDNGAGTQSYVLTLQKNGSDTALTCTISETATSCTDSTNSITFARGDTVSLKSVPVNTPDNNKPFIGYILTNITGDNRLDVLMRGRRGATVSASVTNYVSVFDGPVTTTESEAQFVFPVNGVLSKLLISANTFPGVGKSYLFTVRRTRAGATADTTLTCTLAEGSATSCEDVVNNVSIIAGDTISVSVVPTGTPTALYVAVSAVFSHNNPGSFILSTNTGSTDLSNSAVRYVALNGSAAPSSLTYVNYASVYKGLFLRSFYLRAFTAPDNGAGTQSYDFTLFDSDNSVNEYTCTLSETLTNCLSVDSLVVLSDYDTTYQIKSTPSGTPLATKATVGMALSFQTPKYTLLKGYGISYDPRQNILTLGDSITLGSGSTDQFSYRKRLQTLLGVGKYNFVGSVSSPTDSIYDTDHSAVSGNTTAQLLARLNTDLTSYLTLNTGKAIIIHTGTNDVQNSPSAVAQGLIDSGTQSMIDNVYAADPEIELYIMTMIPQAVSEATDNATTLAANALIVANVQAAQATMPNLHIIDMSTAFLDGVNCTTNQDTCLDDTLHPNDLGYKVMAQIIYNCMTDHTSDYCDGN